MINEPFECPKIKKIDVEEKKHGKIQIYSADAQI